MKKRIISLLMAALMLGSTITGCGLIGPGAEEKSGEKSEKSENASGKVELEFFNQKKEGEAAYNKIIKMFEEENPDIVIKQTAPSDAETVFFTRVSTGDIPDIMSIYPCEPAYQAIMDEGVVAELTGEEFLSRASEAALEYSKYNDKLYCMPFALSSYGFFCNKAMFEEAGLEFPKTWEELISCCEKFKENGMETPLILADKDAGSLGQEGERLVGIIKNDIYKDTESVGLGNGSFKDPDKDWFKALGEAVLQMREYAGDTIAVGRDQATSDFINGKGAMYCTGTYGFTAILDAAPDMDVTMIPIPNPYPGGEQSLPINVDIAVGYSTSTKHPEEAKKFIEFLSRPEVNQVLADEEGTPTVIEGVDYKIEALKDIKQEIETGNTFLTVLNFWPAGFRNEWAIYLQTLLTDKDMDAFLSETDRVCQDYYNKTDE